MARARACVGHRSIHVTHQQALLVCGHSCWTAAPRPQPPRWRKRLWQTRRSPAQSCRTLSRDRAYHSPATAAHLKRPSHQKRPQRPIQMSSNSLGRPVQQNGMQNLGSNRFSGRQRVGDASVGAEANAEIHGPTLTLRAKKATADSGSWHRRRRAYQTLPRCRTQKGSLLTLQDARG